MILDQVYCKKCGNEREIWRNLNDEINEVCESCGTSMTKAFLGLTFSLKGQGWASKGTATAGKVKRAKEVGLKVDYDKKEEMKATGEI